MFPRLYSLISLLFPTEIYGKISIHHIQSLTHFHVYHLYFQDCLAEGRSVSLPASAVGASKLAVTAVGAYARIRKQFRVPIAEMGGVQVLH